MTRFGAGVEELRNVPAQLRAGAGEHRAVFESGSAPREAPKQAKPDLACRVVQTEGGPPGQVIEIGL